MFAARNSISQQHQVRDDEEYPLYSLKDISFCDELKEMLFGFGDKLEPYSGTIKVMDELVKDFMTDLTLRSMDISKRCHRSFDCESIQWAVKSKNDYYQRLKELLTSFDSISSQTRYVASDVDTTAKARKQALKSQEKKNKKQKLNDASVVEV